MPSKNAKELAIFLWSCILGTESGLSLLIKEVNLHLVPERERGVFPTRGAEIETLRNSQLCVVDKPELWLLGIMKSSLLR